MALTDYKIKNNFVSETLAQTPSVVLTVGQDGAIITSAISVSTISGNVNSKIDNNTLSIQSITGSLTTISNSLSGYVQTPLLNSISGNLQTQINNLNTSVNNVTGQFATTTLVAGTSGVLHASINTKIGDAPSDGNQYARKNAAWVIVTGVGSSGAGFIPLAGTGITITPSGSNYSFAVNDYISKTEVNNITGQFVTITLVNGTSGVLQSNINSKVSADILRTEVASISSGLQFTIDSFKTQVVGTTGQFATITLVNGTSGVLQRNLDSFKTQVVGMSADLDTRMTNIESSYITTSIVRGLTGQLATYTLVQGTSGVLQSNINSKVSADILRTEVNSISSGLQFTIDSFKTQVVGTTGSLQTQINAKVSADILRTEVASISSGLNNTKVGDAPSDGNQYARKNAAWEIVTTTSGAGSTFSSLTDVSLTSPASGQIVVYNGTLWANKYSTRNVPFTIVSSTAITSGTKNTMFVAPWKGVIKSWALTCTPSATVTMDVLKSSGAVPTSSIISSNYPSISGSQFNGATISSGWAQSFNINDIFKIKVISNDTASIITLQLNCDIEQ